LSSISRQVRVTDLPYSIGASYADKRAVFGELAVALDRKSPNRRAPAPVNAEHGSCMTMSAELAVKDHSQAGIAWRETQRFTSLRYLAKSFRAIRSYTKNLTNPRLERSRSYSRPRRGNDNYVVPVYFSGNSKLVLRQAHRRHSVCIHSEALLTTF